jgi:ubiquinone/menaquinone biosynthesis C-methylase UbiE
MKLLIEKMKKIEKDRLNYEYLFDFILPFEPSTIAYKEMLPPITDPKEYARNILMLDPIELVLIHWPPGVESAIHLHEGFWGYVGVLEGVALNIEYKLSHGVLKRERMVEVRSGGLIPEPDGIIHKVTNASSTEALVTLHFYYPALKDLNGLKLFCLDGSMVELNSKAPSASLHLPDDCYVSRKKDQFIFEDGEKGKSHLIKPIIPKPSSKEIKEMILAYYRSQARNYDSEDIGNENRRKYVFAINDLLVNEFKLLKPQKVLDIATGTGRRALKIKTESLLAYELFGTDLSAEMCEMATERGIKCLCSDWLQVDFPDDSFDVITMLYAFGHVPDAIERIRFFEKIHSKLKVGGSFYFDVFNINDPFEWGSNAISVFDEYKLDYFGYEKGDVFYTRKGMSEAAFLHYFEEKRLVALLKSFGFSCDKIWHVGYMHRSGEILKRNEGKLFIKATKK